MPSPHGLVPPHDPVPPPHDVDTASAERTRLAWRRTILAATAVALLGVRQAVLDGFTPARIIALALLGGGWLALLRGSQRRIRSMALARPPAAGGVLPAVALLVAGFAALAIVLAAG